MILRVKLIFYEGQYSQIFVQNSPFESTLPHFISNYFAQKKKKKRKSVDQRKKHISEKFTVLYKLQTC